MRALTRDRVTVDVKAVEVTRPPHGGAAGKKCAAVTGVTAPLGFRAAAVAAGIKPDGLDLALLVADAAVRRRRRLHHQPRAGGAGARLARSTSRRGRARAVVVNAGCANAGTGEAGPRGRARDGRGWRPRARLPRRARWWSRPPASSACGCRWTRCAPGSPRRRAGSRARAGADAARAILTTDTQPEGGRSSSSPLGGERVRVGAMAKGAGMIAPNMATMLAFFTTDAAVEPALLRRALREAVGASLNRITVDGDTSTNDMAVVLASGAARRRADRPGRAPTYDAFAARADRGGAPPRAR